jgi:hypothetical protein
MILLNYIASNIGKRTIAIKGKAYSFSKACGRYYLFSKSLARYNRWLEYSTCQLKHRTEAFSSGK